MRKSTKNSNLGVLGILGSPNFPTNLKFKKCVFSEISRVFRVWVMLGEEGEPVFTFLVR
jgi:hypothetical protein